MQLSTGVLERIYSLEATPSLGSQRTSSESSSPLTAPGPAVHAAASAPLPHGAWSADCARARRRSRTLSSRGTNSVEPVDGLVAGASTAKVKRGRGRPRHTPSSSSDAGGTAGRNRSGGVPLSSATSLSARRRQPQQLPQLQQLEPDAPWSVLNHLEQLLAGQRMLNGKLDSKSMLLSLRPPPRLLSREEEQLLGRCMQRAQQLQAAQATLHARLGRQPKLGEVAAHAEVSTQRLQLDLLAGRKAFQLMMHYNKRLVKFVLDLDLQHAAQTGYSDDAVANGLDGLAAAVRRYNPEHGTKFSSYAVHWIRALINRRADMQHGTVLRPVHHLCMLRYIARTWPDMPTSAEERSIMLQKASVKFKISAELVEQVLADAPLHFNLLSLDAPAFGGSDFRGSDSEATNLAEVLDAQEVMEEPAPLVGGSGSSSGSDMAAALMLGAQRLDNLLGCGGSAAAAAAQIACAPATPGGGEAADIESLRRLLSVLQPSEAAAMGRLFPDALGPLLAAAPTKAASGGGGSSVGAPCSSGAATGATHAPTMAQARQARTTLREAAQQLGCSIETVRKLKASALHKMRAAAKRLLQT